MSLAWQVALTRFYLFFACCPRGEALKSEQSELGSAIISSGFSGEEETLFPGEMPLVVFASYLLIF